MGRSKVYRQNLKTLINSVSSKTLYNWLLEQTRLRFGVALQEAELIADKAEIFLLLMWKTSIGNTITINLPVENNNQKVPFDSLQASAIQITVYSHDELSILLKCDLKALPNKISTY